jgi:hypothetical protein
VQLGPAEEAAASEEEERADRDDNRPHVLGQPSSFRETLAVLQESEAALAE